MSESSINHTKVYKESKMKLSADNKWVFGNDQIINLSKVSHITKGEHGVYFHLAVTENIGEDQSVCITFDNIEGINSAFAFLYKNLIKKRVSSYITEMNTP